MSGSRTSSSNSAEVIIQHSTFKFLIEEMNKTHALQQNQIKNSMSTLSTPSLPKEVDGESLHTHLSDSNYDTQSEGNTPREENHTRLRSSSESDVSINQNGHLIYTPRKF